MRPRSDLTFLDVPGLLAMLRNGSDRMLDRLRYHRGYVKPDSIGSSFVEQYQEAKSMNIIRLPS